MLLYIINKINKTNVTTFFFLLFTKVMVGDISSAVLSDFVLFARDTTIITDRSVVYDGIAGANGYVELGCDAKSYGDLQSRHNAKLKDRSLVDGNVTVGGSLTRETGTTVGGTITQFTPVDSIALPVKSFTYGTTDFTANNGEVKSISPGSYEDFYAGYYSEVTFSSGVYNFKTFTSESNVRFVFSVPSDSIIINVQNQITIGNINNATLIGTTNPSKVSIYSNQANQLNIGTDGKLVFKIMAPNTVINVGSRTEVQGNLYARKIVLASDVSIKGVYQENFDQWEHSAYVFLNTSVSGANILENVYNFPVLIRLNSVNFTFSEAMPNGEDIRFTKIDGVTILNYEIERWDATNKVADIWVRVDTLRGNDNLQNFIMRWGKSGIGSQSNGGGVFNTADQFRGVWHLNQNPTSIIADATINGNNGTSQGGMTGSSSISAIIGKGLQFDGTNDYCNLTNNASLQFTGEVTISAWVKSKSNNAPMGIGGKIVVGPYKGFGIHKYNTNYFQFQTGNGTIEEKLPSNVTYTDTNWHYIAGVRRGGTNYLYVDGVQQSATGSLAFTDNGSYASVGKHYANYDGRYWNGTIDELRISSDGRSSAWIKLCYENQKTNQTLVNVISDIDDYQNWPYSQRIYFNTTAYGADIPNDVCNFPFLVRLNSGNFNFNQALSDGKDLRFSDPDGTHLSYEIESWNPTTRQASVWVKVPKVDGNSISDYIVMHYGNFGATDMQNRITLWDSTFAGVWHFDELPPDILHDATANGNSGTSQGGMNANSSIIAAIGKGLRFDGSNDYCNLTNNASLQITGEVTISAWVKSKANNAQIGIGGKIVVGPYKGFGIHKYNTNYFQFQTGNGSIDEKLPSNVAYTDTNWHYIVGVRRGGTNYLYVDGVQQTSTGSLSFTDNESYVCVGKHYANYDGRYWDGTIDEMRISKTGRSADWIKLCYQNQRPDSMTLQVIPAISLTPVFDGSLTNRPSDFDNLHTTMKIVHQGDNPVTDSLSHILIRFDTRGVTKRHDQGWVMENAELKLSVDSLSTPLYQDSANIGIYDGKCILPDTQLNGFKVWSEDQSVHGSVIKMSGVEYNQGISGQPDSSGEWAWVLYDFQSEIKRLGFAIVDSISWYAGTQDAGGNVKTYVKTSSLIQKPSEEDWKNDSAGITTVQNTDGAKNDYEIISSDFTNLRWLWLGTRRTGVDTSACAVWGDFKIYGKRHKNVEVMFYQVRDEGIDTGYLSFSNRGNGLPWRHAFFEQDAGTDSCEGIGTEDLVQVFPGHEPLWNRYKTKYHSRSPVGIAIIPGSIISSSSDSVSVYFGTVNSGRIQPAEMTNGYYPFREDWRADSVAALILDDTVYSTGIGGVAGGNGNYPCLVYNIHSEAARLGFGKLYAIRGKAGYCDGSDSVQVFVKTCTTTVQPTPSNWINNTGGVVQRVSHSSWSGSHYAAVNLTNDGFGGPASNIKWIWLSVYSTKGTGSMSFGAFADLRVMVEPKANYAVSINNNTLSQAIQKAIVDSTNPYITLLGVTSDLASMASFNTSRSPMMTMRPALDLRFSDSKTTLSWEGRDSNLSIPKGELIPLAGTPSVGDGRYGRVVRFHAPNTQYAQVVDSGHIDYLQGVISFYYQMDMSTGSDSGAGAEFFARAGSGTSQFKLCRDGSLPRLIFSFGDTTGDSTGPNQMIWAYIDSSISSIDPFDGNQHYFKFSWDYSTQTVSLSIDGELPVVKKTVAFNSNPQTWAVADLRFGRNIDGYLENLIIRSRTFEPREVVITRTDINNVRGHLPFIQPGFKDTVDCIVICPQDGFFRQECDQYALRNMSLGLRTAVVSLSEINKYYAGSDEQERIRNFLKQAYLSWHSKYLILAGSTDLVPSRKVSFEFEGGHAVTTDRYYACLEGTWNDDGDQYFAESEDKTDLTAELIVARFPAANWNELHTMIERSNMGFGLPPYKEQCTGNSDTVMFTGIKMFNNIGDISDGQHYCNQLKTVIDKGSYTSALQFRTYFPHDDPTNSDTDAVHDRLDKFMNKLEGFPHLWIHFGHGSYGSATIDNVKHNHVWLEPSLLNKNSVFNRFRNLGHVRLVGCEAASQDLNSVARVFLSKPYGGALTYIGTSEYSYPLVESQLLLEECSNMADSSQFIWGDVFKKSAEKVLGINSNWDITKWMVLSRNFMGDPLLPVRSTDIGTNDTLKISLSGNIKRGSNIHTVMVKDKNNRPVEGAQVSITPLTISRPSIDTLGYMGKTYSDVTFGKCVTNRNGQGTLSFTVLQGDTTLCVTATHPDFLSTRKTATLVDSAGTGITSYLYYMFDTDTAHQYGNNNGVAESGEKINLVYIVSTDRLLDSVSIVLDTLGSGIRASLNSKTFYPLGTLAYRLSIRFDLLSCPAGTGKLGMLVKYYSSSVVQDSMMLNIPITGPDIVPVITYLPDGGGDYTPSSGDNIQMRILLGNRYSAEACSVQCKLIENSPYVTVNIDTTEHIPEVRPFSEVFDENIRYSITGGYSEDAMGIIPAKLVITADNMENDTISIDLNPINNVNIDIQAEKVELDYYQGVRIDWNPVKVDEAQNHKSDFLGYVVMRKAYGDTTDKYVLLTPWAVTSTNYYYDRLPDTSVSKFTYRIAVVDSSYNCSAEDTVDVTRPAFIKPSFPIRTAAIMRAPSIGNYDKGNIAGIYTIAGTNEGLVNIFLANGQEAVVKGSNDGYFSDSSALQVTMGDLNDDGFDDAVFVTKSSLIAWDLKGDSLLWQTAINDGGHKPSISCFRKPVLADIDGNGKLEVIVFIVDNSGGISSLDVYNQGGFRLARKEFLDYCYAPAMAVGDFFIGNGDSLEILLIARTPSPMIPEAEDVNLYLLKNFDPYYQVFTEVDSAVVCRWYSNPAQNPKTVNVNTAIAVGNCYGDSSVLEVVMCKGKASWSGSEILDTLMVCRVATSTGTIEKNGTMARYAMSPVTFKCWTIFGSSPSIADIDKDDVDDIVIATDDSLYVLKMITQDSIVPLVKAKFGIVPANRLGGNQFTPQTLVTEFNGQKQIYVNHQGDGGIWAFNIEYSGGAWQANKVPGYPLKTRGRISEAIAITDLEGDDTLDLTAVDDAGYIYAWKLGQGSIYQQPWPMQYGNNWNTSFTGYKEAGAVGYLYEDWKAFRAAPYQWLESDQGGVNDTVSAVNTVFELNNGVLKTDSAGGRNLHFVGPSTNNWKEYTVNGKIKFESSSARFGINVYSSYADSAKKYSIARRPDGKVEWLFYTGPNTKTTLKVSDSVLAPNTGVWYNYKIRVENQPTYNRIRAEFWSEGEVDPTINENYAFWDLDATDGTPNGTRLKSGRVGVFTDSGTGTRSWGPITVVTNMPAEGAYMAYDDFTEDTIVDIAPYVPRNWSPDYGCIRFTSGYDTTGFVFNRQNTSLIYKHKPGSQTPVTCNIAPYTNLEWRDYAFSGKIVKPAGTVYDSIWVGIDVYSSGANQYRVKFRNDTMIVMGGGVADSIVTGSEFDNGDSLYFNVTVSTEDLQVGTLTYKDSVTYLYIKVGTDSSSMPYVFDNRLTGGDRLNHIKGGVPAVYLDLNGRENSATGAIKIDDITVQKVR